MFTKISVLTPDPKTSTTPVQDVSPTSIRTHSLIFGSNPSMLAKALPPRAPALDSVLRTPTS